jgi:Cu(I)/Ag(I) efflux system membrane fusion protein
MKTTRIILILFFAALALNANCKTTEFTTTDPAFQKQLASVFTSYVSLKDAFVASDASKVKDAVSQTLKSLSSVDMKLVKGADHNNWMNYQMTMEKALKEIQTATAIDAQRKSFSILSDALYKSIKTFGLGGLKAYYEFCPMALDGGAYWLSTEQKIRNPYFGDKMLTCGSVKETL